MAGTRTKKVLIEPMVPSLLEDHRVDVSAIIIVVAEMVEDPIVPVDLVEEEVVVEAGGAELAHRHHRLREQQQQQQQQIGKSIYAPWRGQDTSICLVCHPC